jgi:hypothetical protein
MQPVVIGTSHYLVDLEIHVDSVIVCRSPVRRPSGRLHRSPLLRDLSRILVDISVDISVDLNVHFSVRVLVDILFGRLLGACLSRLPPCGLLACR